MSKNIKGKNISGEIPVICIETKIIYGKIFVNDYETCLKNENIH